MIGEELLVLIERDKTCAYSSIVMRKVVVAWVA